MIFSAASATATKEVENTHNRLPFARSYVILKVKISRDTEDRCSNGGENMVISLREHQG